MRQKTENFFIQNFQSRAGCLIFTVFFLLGCAAGACLGIRGTADAPEWTAGYVNRLLEQGRPHFAFLLLRTVRFWLLFYAFGFTRLGLLLVPLLIFLRGLLLGDCFAIWFTCCSGSGCIWAACCYAALTLPLTMRDIHWKLSAKTDKLIVREAQEPDRGQVLLTFDLSGSRQQLDETFDTLFWLSRWLLAHEVAHSVCWLDPGSFEPMGAAITKEEELQELLRGLFDTRLQDGTPSIAEHPFPRADWRYHIRPAGQEVTASCRISF